MRRDYIPAGTAKVIGHKQIIADPFNNRFEVEVDVFVSGLNQAITINVPVYDFSQFRVGNVFDNQVPVKSEGEVTELTVYSETARSVEVEGIGKASELEGNIGNRKVKVLIPATEIFRAYFCLTPFWGHSLMCEPISIKDLRMFNLMSCYKGRILEIFPKKGVPTELYSVLAHLFYDSYSRRTRYARASLSIANSITEKFALNYGREPQRVFLACPFPFDKGKVALRCYVSEDKNVTLVKGILSSTIAPIPKIEKILVHRPVTVNNMDDETSMPAIEQSSPQEKKVTKRKHSKRKKGKASLSAPDLKTVFTFEQEPEVIGTSYQEPARSSKLVSTEGKEVGAGGSSASAESDDVSPPGFDPSFRPPSSKTELHLDVCGKLAEFGYEKTDISISASNMNGLSSAPPSFTSEEEVNAWSKFPSKDGNWICRPVHFTKFEHSDCENVIHLIDIVCKKSDDNFRYYVLIGEPMNENKIRYLLELISLENGRIKNYLWHFEEIGLKAYSFNHSISLKSLLKRCSIAAPGGQHSDTV